MSRSYRKEPIIKCCPSSSIGKRFANRRVRRYTKELSDGCSYRRLYSSWDIHDYVCRVTINDHLESWGRWKILEERNGFPMSYFGTTIQNAIKKWKLNYYWK